MGLPIAVWRSYIAHRQAETAHTSLLAERYQRAVEMLGGKEAVPWRAFTPWYAWCSRTCPITC